MLAVFSLVYLTLHAGGTEAGGFGSFGDRIGVVDLDGVILSPQPVVGQLKKFGDDSSIKAIIIHVNSPGGGVAASEEIYREVKRIRDEKKKRIVVSIETVGASGAFYVASASNKIYADKGSIVGSIGVIAQWVNYGDLLKWAKLKDVVIKTGEFKDTGNPARDLTPSEQAYMQSLIDNMFGQFIQAVADGRKLKFDDVKSIANGKVWTGEQALSMKLIDQVGDFESRGIRHREDRSESRANPRWCVPTATAKPARSFDWRHLAISPGPREDAGAAGQVSTICGSSWPAAWASGISRVNLRSDRSF